MNRRSQIAGRLLSLMVVTISLGSNGGAQQPAAKDRSPLDELRSEYDEASKAWEGKYSGQLTTPSAQLIERYDAWPAWSFIPRIVKLGTADAAAPYSFAALKWFVDLSSAVGAIDQQYYPYDEQVVAALRIRHLADPRIVEVFSECSSYVTPAREALLRECVEKGATRDVRGLACHYLAECLGDKATLASAEWLKVEADPADAFQKHTRGRWSSEYLAFVRSIDLDKSQAEAKALAERVLDEFGDVPSLDEFPFTLGRPTLAFLDRFRRAQMEAISVGKPAPDLVSKDLDGKERKLSDYKGKVVVLHFWATWCPPCVEKIPQLKDLAKQYENQPVSVLGVNYDRDRQAAVEFVQEHRMAWPSWWAIAMGESMGRWFVDGREGPSILVLDHAGVLRHHGIEGDALDKAVESLLRERAEKAAGQ